MSIPSDLSSDAFRVLSVGGDPRAMGAEQGRFFRDAVRRVLDDQGVRRSGRFGWLLAPFVGGPVLGGGMAREIVRHYPHLSERFQGIAHGAGVSIESIAELFVRATEGRVDAGLVDPCPGALRAGADPILCRPLPTGEWCVRRSRPEVGFPSVELTLPWLATSFAGVNEAGVGVVAAPCAAGRAGTDPSALLLVQECLQRFHDLPGCIDWCSKRPASGRLALLIADASGASAVVNLEDGERTVREWVQGCVAAGGCEERHPDLSKALASVTFIGADPASEAGARLLVSPADRALRVFASAGAPVSVFSAL